MKKNIKFYFICFITVYCIGCNTNSSNNQSKLDNKNISNFNNENIQFNFNIKIDTLFVQPIHQELKNDMSLWIHSYDVKKDNIYIKNGDSLFLITKDSYKYINRFNTNYYMPFLHVCDNFIIEDGGLEYGISYLFDRHTMKLIDTIENLHISSYIKEDKFVMFNENENFYFIYDFNIMDSIYTFPKNMVVTYLDNKYYLSYNNEVDVLCNLDNKCEELKNQSNYFIFGFFKGKYFGVNERKIHFYGNQYDEDGFDIDFGYRQKRQKIQIYKNKLYVYGWIINEINYCLIRYEIDIVDNISY